MNKDKQLGLDELMIVNPSSPVGTESMFLGEDGKLYQVQGLGEESTQQGVGQYFLGIDGSLYQVQSLGAIISAAFAKNLGGDLGEEDVLEIGHYYLGGDGVLYEVVR